MGFLGIPPGPGSANGGRAGKWFGFLQLSIKSGWNEPWKFMVVYELVLVLQGTKMTFKNPKFYSSLLLIAAELD